MNYRCTLHNITEERISYRMSVFLNGVLRTIGEKDGRGNRGLEEIA